MFALHETIQRRVCRVSFLLLCVVPTVLTLVGVAYCNRPWRARDWQHSLTSHLHVRAELEDVSRPVPGTIVLAEVHFADLQTDAPLGWTEQLRCSEQDGRLLLEAETIELPGEQLGSLFNACKTWFATDESSPITFRANQLVLTGNAGDAYGLKDLSIDATPTNDNACQIQLLGKNSADEPLKIKLEQRGRIVRCMIDAKQASVPAWLLGQLVPAVEGCGEAAFTGSLIVDEAANDHCGTLVGKIKDVEVRNWAGTAAHQLQGLATIELEQVTWQDDSLEFARGRIQVDQGAMTYKLLLDMQEKLLLPVGTAWQYLQPETQSDLVPFEKLTIGFELSHQGLVLTGDDSGQVAIGVDGPLLLAPQENQLLPVAQIIQLFHAPMQGWFPDTQAAHEMAEKLPLPGNESANTPASRR